MSANSSQPQIEGLAFAGSLRKGSYNKALLRAAKDLSPEKLTITIHDIAEIPLLKDVEEQGYPDLVVDFKKEIDRACVLLIATPEYNYCVPGVTKNAIDWASRSPDNSPLDKKPVGVVGASPSITGSARGPSQLWQAFGYTNTYCLQQPEIMVCQAHKKFEKDGTLNDEKTREFLEKYLQELYSWTCNFIEI